MKRCGRSAAILCILLSSVVIAAPAANWRARSNRAISVTRKVDLQIIVLDRRGHSVTNADVHIQQLRHAFPWGVTIGDSAIRDKTGEHPALQRKRGSVWEAFNAVSLHPYAAWEQTHQQMADENFESVDRMLGWAERHGLIVRWGRMICSDPGRVPPWVSKLKGEELADAMGMYVRQVLSRYGNRVQEYDLYENLVDHGPLTEQVGMVAVRRLFEMAQAGAPNAQRMVRFEDAWPGGRMQELIRRVTLLQQSFVPVDAVALELRTAYDVDQALFSKRLRWLTQLRMPVVVVGMSCGGSSPDKVADNLEIALRALYSNEMIKGIWFSRIEAGATSDPSSALLDKNGEPTPAGWRLRDLLRNQWWTDYNTKTDSLGRVNASVYPGLYDLFAKLPDGTQAYTSAYFGESIKPRIIVLQPMP